MNIDLQLIPPSKKLVHGRGEFHVHHPGKGVLLLTAHGYGEEPLARLVCREMEEAALAAGGPIEVFTDDRQLTGYEPAYRAAFEQWLGGCWRSITAIHLLVESKSVQLDMAVMSLKLGESASYHMYQNFADWNQRYQQALQR